MAKKRASSFLSVLLVALLLLVMALTLILSLYKMERYKPLNEFIDSVISNFIHTEEPVVEDVSFVEIPRITIEAGFALAKIPFFLGEISNNQDLNDLHLRSLEHNAVESGITIQVSSDYKSLTVKGMLQKLDPSYDGADESVSSWTLHTEYPIITRPCLFQDSIVFIDSSPSLFVVNILTGTASSGQYVPFFPDTQASALQASVDIMGMNNELNSVQLPQYVVLGRNGKVYSFAFTEDYITLPSASMLSISSDVFTPSSEDLEHMVDSIKNWAGISEDTVLNAPLLLSDDFTPLYINLETPAFITFMIPESGRYIAGLSDENGLFIRDNAVVCIFSDKGELVGVSVDYVSDRPNLTLHLEEKKIYYVLAAALSGSSIDSSYFSIKKAAN